MLLVIWRLIYGQMLVRHVDSEQKLHLQQKARMEVEHINTSSLYRMHQEIGLYYRTIRLTIK